MAFWPPYCIKLLKRSALSEACWCPETKTHPTELRAASTAMLPGVLFLAGACGKIATVCVMLG